nr:ubiquitin hydrolase [Tanacetum cinerariifolium]
MHKAFPLPVIEFPLAEEVPTASEESCHCQKKREATAVKIALLLKNNCNIVYKDSLSYKRSPLVIVESISRLLSATITLIFKAEDPIIVSTSGLAQVESRLAEPKDREIKYCEKIRGLEFKTESSDDYIEILKKELDLIKKEKEGRDSKLTGFQTASKDLDSLLESQRLDKNKEGLGYKFANDTVTDYSRPSPTVESSPDDAQNRNPSVTTTEASPCTISPKPFIKFVKAAERLTIDKVETAKKPAVKYAKVYRKTTKRSTVRGNQRNWNNLKSQQLEENFVIKNKACFNYGHFDHLSYNCGFGVKIGRSSHKNNYTHRSLPP